ncbi:hypothetical protein E2C01_089819 [Portunus trituberculatus]|uniref:Uncharacterized protein n=1 Tax=Portunus trituberculatus TaxID=210409 RepID=A0A5B7J9V3_PORTR|nr:hypothetical protein [Portunus trituberculatus]
MLFKKCYERGQAAKRGWTSSGADDGVGGAAR